MPTAKANSSASTTTPDIFHPPMFMYINMIMSFVLMTIILHIFLKKSMTTNVDITLAELYM